MLFFAIHIISINDFLPLTNVLHNSLFTFSDSSKNMKGQVQV